MTGSISLCQQLANIWLQGWVSAMRQTYSYASAPFKYKDQKKKTILLDNKADKIAKICT